MFNAGDIAVGSTVIIPFNTFLKTGSSGTIATPGSIKIYKNGSATERSSSSGVTVTTDFDSKVGRHIVSIDISDNTDSGFYSSGDAFLIAYQDAVVDGETLHPFIGAFQILRTTALRPTTAGRTLLVSSGGGAAVDWANVLNPTSTVTLSNTLVNSSLTQINGVSITADGEILHLGIIDQGTAQSVTSTSVVLRAASSFADDSLTGSWILVRGSTQGYTSSPRQITSNVQSTDTVSFDRAFDVTPTGTITYKIFGAPAGPGSKGYPQVSVAAVGAAGDVLSTIAGTNFTTLFHNSASGSSLRIIDIEDSIATTSNIDTNVNALGVDLTALTSDVAGLIITANSIDSNVIALGVDLTALTSDVADVMAALPRRVRRNVAYPNFIIYMGSIGLTVTAILTKDAGATVATTNPVQEISDGFYFIDFEQAEMNAIEIGALFTGGSVKKALKIITQE